MGFVWLMMEPVTVICCNQGSGLNSKSLKFPFSSSLHFLSPQNISESPANYWADRREIRGSCVAPQCSVAVVPLITTRSLGGLTMDVRSVKTQVTVQTKLHTWEFPPSGDDELVIWYQNLQVFSYLDKISVQGSTGKHVGNWKQAFLSAAKEVQLAVPLRSSLNLYMLEQMIIGKYLWGSILSGKNLYYFPR